MTKDIFLVDADNTLLDFHGSSFLAIREAFEKFGVAWREEFASVFTKLNDGLWEKLERKEITREKLIEVRFPLYLQELGFSTIDGEEFNKTYLHLLSVRPLFIEGAEEFLKALKKKGKVYIVTNGTERIQKSRFDILNLWQYADGVFVSSVIGWDKPDARYTEYVLSHIEGFESARAVWIGDSLSADIKAANDAKIDSIWFNPEEKKLNGGGILPTKQAKNFQEILTILQIN